jgi:hypothetical protein
MIFMAYTFWQNTGGDIRLADGKQITFNALAEIFPFVTNPHDRVVVEKDRAGNILYIDSLGRVTQNFGIDPELSDDEALAAVNAMIQAGKEAVAAAAAEPTAEERIAAMMEYQALAGLPE